MTKRTIKFHFKMICLLEFLAVITFMIIWLLCRVLLNHDLPLIALLISMIIIPIAILSAIGMEKIRL